MKKKKKIKKSVIFIFMLLILGIAIFAYNFINTIHSWDFYLEITNDYINVREKNIRDSRKLGEVKKGETYKIIDVNQEDQNHLWYKIKYNKKEAWIASDRYEPYVKVYNNEIEIKDIKSPKIRYYNDVYETESVDTINYDHLEIIDDSNEFNITHKLYYDSLHYKEYKEERYWIEYIVEDKAGHISEKKQKIEFTETKPDKNSLPDIKD